MTSDNDHRSGTTRADLPGSAKPDANTPPSKAEQGYVAYEDDYVIVTIPFGWGMRQIKAKIKSDISPIAFNEIPRSIHQSNMDEYFRASMEVFDSSAFVPRVTKKLALAVRSTIWPLPFAFAGAVGLVLYTWFAFDLGSHFLLPAITAIFAVAVTIVAVWRLERHLVTDKLWPGLLEERLKEGSEIMFAHADADIRRVIDAFVDTFLENNRTRIRWKRQLQILSIILAYGGALPVLLFFHGGHQNILIFVGVLVLLWGLAIGLFLERNEKLFRHIYRQTLNNSAQDVSTVIMNRMTSLTALFKDFYNNIQQLQEKGEDLGIGDITHRSDDDLKEGNGFFSTRMLIWLAKRLEDIEAHLLFGMQTAETVLSVLNIAGYVATNVILLIALIPLIAFVANDTSALYAIYSSGLRVDPGVVYALEFRVVVALATAVVVAAISRISYNRKGWNSGRDILKSCFDTAAVVGWNTFAKLKFDVRLAGRCQRAMDRIHHLDKKTVLGGG